jgi:hypothetical protein
MEFYTFVGAIPELDDFTLIIRTPKDWENVTVYNAYGTPVTASCIVKQGNITIPNSLLSTLGWWELHLESPNYLHTLQTLKLNEASSSWLPDDKFRTTNITKPMIVIGDESPISTTLKDVNVSWFMPNGELWFSELISDGTDGSINGSQLEFGPVNTTAGFWCLCISWTNGTEIAFGGLSFEIMHGTTLSPYRDSIETEIGLIITNFVYFQDSENDEFITNPAASVTANWSASTITFVPDPILNRWIGDFDTSLLGPGSHLVVVNASRPSFDDASCTFIITISFKDNVLEIDNTLTEIGFGDSFIATFSYSDLHGSGIPGADVTISFTGFAGGLTWDNLIDYGDGTYSVQITAVHSDDYELTISASKEFYDASEDSLVILVGEKTAFLTLENGTSDAISFGEQYRLIVRYTNATGSGILGADVSVFSTTPEGINYTSSVDEGEGFYSFILTPTSTKSYTLIIRASFTDHETQLVSFTLTATEIAAQIRTAGDLTSATVGVTQDFLLLVFYEQTSGTFTNITGADVSIQYTSLATLPCVVVPQTEGYLINISAVTTGLYEFTISVNHTGYQDDIILFRLIVQEIGIQMERIWTGTGTWSVPYENGIYWERDLEGNDLNISIRLTEVDSGSLITNATVSFRLSRSSVPQMDGLMTEVSDGVYSILIRPTWFDDPGYTVRIFVDIDNYALDREYEFQVIQHTPQDILIGIIVATYGPPIVILAGLAVVSLSGRSVYRRRRKAEFARYIADQRRFDDADNIIGVIVMHKKSGIPIYSRIVKGGFEEGIVAAFISAVTTFRDEFEMLDEESMKAIPISDIIRAVQTPNLICAFITVRSASIEHNRKIEEFSRETSRYLDDFYVESKPPSTMDPRIAEIINYVFDETMDGVLLKYHKLSSKKIPKRYESIENVLLETESKYCSKPVNLARALSKYGVPEARGCTLVSEAIEKELIVLCEEEEYPESDFDLQSFLDSNKNSEE